MRKVRGAKADGDAHSKTTDRVAKPATQVVHTVEPRLILPPPTTRCRSVSATSMRLLQSPADGAEKCVHIASPRRASAIPPGSPRNSWFGTPPTDELTSQTDPAGRRGPGGMGRSRALSEPFGDLEVASVEQASIEYAERTESLRRTCSMAMRQNSLLKNSSMRRNSMQRTSMKLQEGMRRISVSRSSLRDRAVSNPQGDTETDIMERMMIADRAQSQHALAAEENDSFDRSDSEFGAPTGFCASPVAARMMLDLGSVAEEAMPPNTPGRTLSLSPRSPQRAALLLTPQEEETARRRSHNARQQATASARDWLSSHMAALADRESSGSEDDSPSEDSPSVDTQSEGDDE